MKSIIYEYDDGSLAIRCDCGRVYKRKPNAKYHLDGGCIDCATTGKNNVNYKHGLAHKTRLYKVWRNMKHRCYNKNDKRYHCYGGRGIKVCDEWSNDFMSFYNWAMSDGYKDDLTIDRIDVNGDYCPSNCRWITAVEQQNNTTRTRKFIWNGVLLSMKQISVLENKPYDRVKSRVRAGWSISDAINKKSRYEK